MHGIRIDPSRCKKPVPAPSISTEAEEREGMKKKEEREKSDVMPDVMLHDASACNHSDGLVSVSTSLVGVYLSDDAFVHMMFLLKEG